MIVELSNKLEDVKFDKDQSEIKNKQLELMNKELSNRNTKLSKDLRAYKE